MKLRVTLPEEIEMVAVGSDHSAEHSPTMSVALYRDGVEAGEVTDGRLTGECVFGNLRARAFFPGSGCGLAFDESNRITFAEQGLQAFVGKLTSEIAIEEGVMIVVWKDKRAPQDKLAEFWSQIYRVMNGLVMAFA